MKSSLQFIAILLAALFVCLIPINSIAGVLYLRNGEAIPNAKDIQIKGQDVHYTVEGKAHRIKVEYVEQIEWISNEIKREPMSPTTETEKQTDRSSGYRDPDCSVIGYHFGICATFSMNGRPCYPEDDVIIPPECRGEKETARGIKMGVESAKRELGLPLN